MTRPHRRSRRALVAALTSLAALATALLAPQAALAEAPSGVSVNITTGNPTCTGEDAAAVQVTATIDPSTPGGYPAGEPVEIYVTRILYSGTPDVQITEYGGTTGSDGTFTVSVPLSPDTSTVVQYGTTLDGQSHYYGDPEYTFPDGCRSQQPDPDPTPSVTPSVSVACVDGGPIATVDLAVASVPAVATGNSVDGGWDLGVYDVLNYQPLQADKPIVYNISPGIYTFTGPVPVGSYQWFIDSNDYIVGEFTIAADACPTPTPSATPAASLSSSNTAPGQTVTVTASGLAENEPVEIWLHSTPVMLWSGSASADGSLTQTVTIPAGTEIGNHQIEVRGATSGSLWLNLTVSDRLAATGFDAATAGVTGGVSALLLACGIAVLWAARRKGEFRVHD